MNNVLLFQPATEDGSAAVLAKIIQDFMGYSGPVQAATYFRMRLWEEGFEIVRRKAVSP